MSNHISNWRSWNQKAHIYLGLYFLFFLWLFALSGLLLNHSWRFTEFWNQRRQTSITRTITPPVESTDLARARELMRQLDLQGEIEWTVRQQAQDRLDFRVARPGWIREVKTDFTTQQAVIQEIRVNGWGLVRMLHAFNGVRGAGGEAERDWILTKLWTFAMDALAVGMILMVLTSLVMAWQRREKRIGSAIALALGLLVSLFFSVGLRWL